MQVTRFQHENLSKKKPFQPFSFGNETLPFSIGPISLVSVHLGITCNNTEDTQNGPSANRLFEICLHRLVTSASDLEPVGPEFEPWSVHSPSVLRQNTSLSQNITPPTCMNQQNCFGDNLKKCWEVTCDELVAGGGGARNTPRRFILRKTEISQVGLEQTYNTLAPTEQESLFRCIKNSLPNE